MTRPLLLIFLALPATMSTVPAQESPGVAARFEGGTVSWPEFWIELARRHRGKELGKDALAFLLQRRLVLRESKRRDVMVGKGAIESRLKLVREALRSQKTTLAAYLAPMGMSLEEFRETTRISLLANELVRMDLGLPGNAAVESKDLALWVREMRKRYSIETDASKLPADVALQIDEERIGLKRLGRIMMRKLPVDDRRDILEQMVAYRILSGKAKKHDVRISQADVDRQLERRREEVRANPRYQGLKVTFDDLVRAQGRSLHDFLQGEVFRAQLYIELLGEKLYPDDVIDEQLESRKDYWLDRFGKTRAIYRLVLRGREEGKAAPEGAPAMRTLAEAEAKLREFATGIENAEQFSELAKRVSEEPSTRARDGYLGYQPRWSAKIPSEFLKRAFELEIGKLSPPLPIEGGYALALVTDEKPAPPRSVLRKQVRRAAIREDLRRWIRESKAEFPGL